MTKEFEIPCPPDKSITHRAFILAALANGPCVIENSLLSADTRATLHCLQQLGAQINIRNSVVEISPAKQDAVKKVRILDCANSGTSARLLMGVLAGVNWVRAKLVGDQSLMRRPMGRVVGPLRTMGAKIEMNPEGTLPVEVFGAQLVGAHHEVSVGSAQVKSAILLAALRAVGTTSLRMPTGSRDHTELMLKHLGVQLEVRHTKDSEEITLVGPQIVPPFRVAVPGDPSSAAFFCALGLLDSSGRRYFFRNIAASPTRTEFLKIMNDMTGSVHIVDRSTARGFCEPVVDFWVTGASNIRPCIVEAPQVPRLIDEVPILASLAIFAKGRSVFKGLSELRVKESNRLEKIKELLQLAGADVAIEGDDLHVEGGVSVVKNFDFDPDGDHRLAMAAGVLSKRAHGACHIRDKGCVDVSFPGFFSLLESIC
ncbi:MAG: 3-phosphoshikimate 1-carboxyvinyltransferase [Oligoflexales bacterium]